jgi:hypothetical protein
MTVSLFLCIRQSLTKISQQRRFIIFTLEISTCKIVLIVHHVPHVLFLMKAEISSVRRMSIKSLADAERMIGNVCCGERPKILRET